LHSEFYLLLLDDFMGRFTYYRCRYCNLGFMAGAFLPRRLFRLPGVELVYRPDPQVFRQIVLYRDFGVGMAGMAHAKEKRAKQFYARFASLATCPDAGGGPAEGGLGGEKRANATCPSGGNANRSRGTVFNATSQ